MAKPLTSDTQVVNSTPRRKILHVEDSADFAGIVRILLESRDYDVTQAADGLSGLIAFNQDPEQWSAVILDLSLPHLSGAALLNEMHRIRPGLPLIVLTGDRSDETLHLYGKGAVIVWHKPISAQDLVENLKAVVG
jgi:DNA-binding response OmpR family regulator